MTVHPDPGSVVLVRHGATEWSESGRHTGTTDLPLLLAGRRRAEQLADALDPDDYGLVLCSPLRRARETCQLAGLGAQMEICEQLREWDYGDYEGMTTPEIHARRPDWFLWRDGCPNGETPEQVVTRADQVLELATRDGKAPAILFAHGHILRVVAARWIGLEAEGGSRLLLRAGAISMLGHERDVRVIAGWNMSALG